MILDWRYTRPWRVEVTCASGRTYTIDVSGGDDAIGWAASVNELPGTVWHYQTAHEAVSDALDAIDRVERRETANAR